MTKYCYSLDEECFKYESIGDLIDDLKSNTGDPVGTTYWRGEAVEITHAECIDVDGFLETCDERVYEKVGEVYDSCFAGVDDAAKTELHELLVAWSKKHVNMRCWKVTNTKEMKITQEDLK